MVTRSRRPQVVGEEPTDAEEVDEVSEQLDSPSLNEFLHDVLGTSTLALQPAPILPSNSSTIIDGQQITSQQGDLPDIRDLKKLFKTKSAAIRYMHAQGHSVLKISKHLNLRYQHVRNVLTTQLKRGPNEPFSPTNYRSPTLGPDPESVNGPVNGPQNPKPESGPEE